MLLIALPRDLSLGRGLAQAAGEQRDWYGLGPRPLGQIRLFVVRGEQPQLGPSWGAGYANPATNTILIRADAPNPHRTLRHELAHLALHGTVRVRVPLWFDEGYAALASGELDRLDALRMNLSVARGAVPDFFQLDRALRAGESTAQAAYALAASAVGMLARRHPSRSLNALLARLGAGESFDSAVLATTGSHLGRFEVEWQKDVRHRFGILTWLIAGGFWAVVAGAVLLAVWVRRRRDRPRRLALDQGWVVEEDPEASRLDEAGPAP